MKPVFRADFRPMTRALDDLAKRQVPFAVAQGLNTTAQLIAKAEERKLPSIFDKPTPFTKKAFGVKQARKSSLSAVVFVKPIQASYLKIEEDGGTRQPKKQAIVIPRAIRRDQHGNMARNALRNLKRRKDIFIGKPEGAKMAGFYRRLPDDKMQPLVLFTGAARYKPRFGFKRRATATAGRIWPPVFRDALGKALATARK